MAARVEQAVVCAAAGMAMKLEREKRVSVAQRGRMTGTCGQNSWRRRVTLRSSSQYHKASLVGSAILIELVQHKLCSSSFVRAQSYGEIKAAVFLATCNENEIPGCHPPSVPLDPEGTEDSLRYQRTDITFVPKGRCHSALPLLSFGVTNRNR